MNWVGPEPGLRRGLTGFKIHLLVFHRLPEPFNDHVIAPTSLAIHADLYLVRFQEIGELQVGELTSVVWLEKLINGNYLFTERLKKWWDSVMYSLGKIVKFAQTEKLKTVVRASPRYCLSLGKKSKILNSLISITEYYSLFEDGHLMSAYEKKMVGLRNLLNAGFLNSNESEQVCFYLDIMQLREKIPGTFSRSCKSPSSDLYDLTNKIDNTKQGLFKNNYESVHIHGPFSIESNMTCNSNALHIFIKPDLSKCNSGAESNICAYYNSYDYEINQKNILDSIDKKKIRYVFTPNYRAQLRNSHYHCDDFRLMRPLGVDLAVIKLILNCVYLAFPYIYLSGFPFYTGSKFYPPEYKSAVNDKHLQAGLYKGLLSSLSKHDLLFNFVILRSLWRLKLFNCDEMLGNAIEQSPEDFLLDFEKKVQPS